MNRTQSALTLTGVALVLAAVVTFIVRFREVDQVTQPLAAAGTAALVVVLVLWLRRH